MFSGGTNIARIQKTKTPKKFKDSYDDLERSKSKRKPEYRINRREKEKFIYAE